MSPEDGLKGRTVESHAGFLCTYCGAGANRYGLLFTHGCCLQCGGPAGTFVETITPIGEEELRQSLLLVYGPDMAKVAGEILKEMEEAGVEVIDVPTLAEGLPAGELGNTLGYLVEKARISLVIPSKGLRNDSCLDGLIDDAFIAGKKIAGIFVNSERIEGFTLLETRAGIDWNDKGHGWISRERFLDEFGKPKTR